LTPDAVVLFDIDGTLLRRAGPHHRAALIEAVRTVAGLETSFDGIAPQGMLDCDIITRMMFNAGASEEEIARHMAPIVDEAQNVYTRTAPDLRRRVCPGVRPTLRRLAQAGIPLGLVTGNLTAIGWRKMEQAGLLRYFRFGAFAEQATTRAGLVEIALRRARRSGWVQRTTTVSLIGDHPNDILAAKLNGIRSIAVASGLTSKRELAAHKPDVLLSDLRCLNHATLL
jgi:phosphoglycolate phosphatase-like HAD superfamily hydrolase